MSGVTSVKNPEIKKEVFEVVKEILSQNDKILTMNKQLLNSLSSPIYLVSDKDQISDFFKDKKL